MLWRENMRIEEIVIASLLLYVIVYFASKKASEQALKSYDAFNKKPLIEMRLNELKDLKIIDELEFKQAIDYYSGLDNSQVKSKKLEKYKAILLELEGNNILESENRKSRQKDLEDIFIGK